MSKAENLRQVEAEVYRRERTLTLRQEFDEYMKRTKTEKSESEETDAFKYLLIASAYQDLEAGKITEMVIWTLKRATTVAKLEELVMDVFAETSRTLRAIKKNGGALKYIEFVDSQAKQIVSELADVSVKVAPDEVKEGGFVDRAVLDRAIAESGEKVNIVTVRRDENDPFMQNSRNLAQQAVAYLHGGMHIEEMQTADDNSTNNEQRVAEAFETAAAAIEAYRQAEEDPITRADGDPSHFAMYAYADYYSALSADSKTSKNLAMETWFIEEVYTSTRDTQDESCKVTLNLLPVLDCALFVPLLALMWHRHAMPRIVEFSRIYRIYAAAMTVCKTMVDMPTEKSAAAAAAKLSKKIAKMQKKNPTIASNPDGVPDERLTAEKVERLFKLMREHSLQNFRHKWQELFQVYQSEKLQHSDRDDKALVEYKSMFGNEKVALDPHLIEKWYYGRLWYESQNFCVDLLMAMELVILAHLQDFVHVSHHELFRVRRLLPYAAHTNSLTESLVKENNASLTSGRQDLWARLQADAKFKKAATNDLPFALFDAPLADTTALDGDIVFADQPWAPTFAQMKRFHSDNCNLLNMSPEQHKVAISVWSQKPKT